MNQNETPKEGDLRVWHIPQVPGSPFTWNVSTPDEAVNILNLLGEYDNFEYEENIKPDYSNAGGLEVYENGEWVEWYDEELGRDIQEYADAKQETK